MSKEERKLKNPNIFIYSLFFCLSWLISKFLKLKILRNEIKNTKRPYVILANHESQIDFIYLCAANSKRKHFVISNSFYQSSKIYGLLKNCGVIPKQQFQTSYDDLKKMKQSINKNIPLVLYPAGIMSENGLTTILPKGTGKSLRWFDCDVYIAKISGSYLTYPKWSKKMRKGKTTLDIYKLFNKEDINQYSDEQLQKIIEKELFFSAYENQEKDLIIHKNGNDIAGLENVLYQCPKCLKEFSMYHQNHKLICNNCHNSAISDKYGFLNKTVEDDIVFKYPSDWALFIENNLIETIKNSKKYELTDNCQIAMINYKKHRFEIVGNGSITLDKNMFKIDGFINNKQFMKTFSNHEFFMLPFSPGAFFEIQDGKVIYRIYLNKKQEVYKWMLTLKTFYKIRHSNNTIKEKV